MSSDRPAILDLLNAGILRVDGSLRVVELNSAAEQLLRTTQNQVQGRSMTDIPALGEYADTARRAIDDREALKHLAAEFHDSRADLHFTPYGPEQAPELLIEVLPVYRPGELIDRDRQHSALAELLRGLAHEIKNPLGGLRGAAQLLQRQLPDEELQDYTRVIIAEADRLTALVDRLQRDPAPPIAEPVNIHEVLEHVHSLLSAGHGDSVAIRRDYDPSLPSITGDHDRLVQAVLNLANNAVEAGCGEVILRTRVQRQVPIGPQTLRSALALEVSDDGPGVPEELRDLLFYPLISGRPSGSGLGLAIAQRIAAEHGGVIRYTSEPGETTFTCLLPMAREAAAEANP